jgi:hypothetical protein
MAETITPTGPITLADVRQALGDTNPSNTNAGALRAILGRGSYATIQKHLDAIRAERSPVVPVAPGAAPTAPADAVAAIWGAAWSQAQALTLGRLEAVTEQRDQLGGTVAQLGQDLASALASVDAGEAAAATASAEQVAALAEAQAEAKAATEQAEAMKQALEAAKTALDRLKVEGDARVALMTRDAQIAAQVMQTTIDNLNAQVHQRDMLLSQVHASKR